VEQFAAIRRDHWVDGLPIRALADKHGVHRRTVRQAPESAMPPPRKTAVRAAPRLEPFKTAIDSMLRGDLDAPQEATAHGEKDFGAAGGRAWRGRVVVFDGTPVNASLRPHESPTHDSGPPWIATPSMSGVLIPFLVPVYPGAFHRFHGLRRDSRGSALSYPLTTRQALLYAADRSVAPTTVAFDAGLRPDPFPDRAASLLPGFLTTTWTGLSPAGDHELPIRS
jgi:hypothetical protein